MLKRNSMVNFKTFFSGLICDINCDMIVTLILMWFLNVSDILDISKKCGLHSQSHYKEYKDIWESTSAFQGGK